MAGTSADGARCGDRGHAAPRRGPIRGDRGRLFVGRGREGERRRDGAGHVADGERRRELARPSAARNCRGRRRAFRRPGRRSTPVIGYSPGLVSAGTSIGTSHVTRPLWYRIVPNSGIESSVVIGGGGDGPRGLQAGELLEGDQRRLAAGVVVAVGVGVDVPVGGGRERDFEPGAVAGAGDAGDQAARDFYFGAFGLEGVSGVRLVGGRSRSLKRARLRRGRRCRADRWGRPRRGAR